MAISKSHNRLRELRRLSGLTLREVAYAVCIDLSAAARYESGDQQPTLDIALRYEELYQVPVSELFPGMRVTAARRIVTRLKVLIGRLRGCPQQSFRDKQKLLWLSGRLAKPMLRIFQSLQPCPLRVLALDARRASFGFAVLEGADRVLDWGARRSRKTGKRGLAGLARKLQFLLRLWHPSVILIRRTRSLPLRIVPLHRKIARAERLPVQILKPEAMKWQFAGGHRVPQGKIVASLAKRFPLVAGGPSYERKIFKHEPYQLSALMAVAAGMAYSASRSNMHVAP